VPAEVDCSRGESLDFEEPTLTVASREATSANLPGWMSVSRFNHVRSGGANGNGQYIRARLLEKFVRLAQSISVLQGDRIVWDSSTKLVPPAIRE